MLLFSIYYQSFNIVLCKVIINLYMVLETSKLIIDEVFLTLLGHKSKQIVTNTTKAIAEIAKTEKGREKCTNAELIQALIDLLKKNDIDILTPASRAVGNICYDNGCYNILINIRIYLI